MYYFMFFLTVELIFEGREYIIVKDDKKSWDDARRDCRQRDTENRYNLASIVSQEELEFLKDYA